MTGSAIWLKCPECANVWKAVDLPMEAVAACKMLIAAFCPKCGNDSPQMAAAADIPPARQENEMSDTIRAPGGYFIHKAGSNRRREIPTLEAAEAEARTIQALSPEHSFIIAQEIARVVPHG